MKSLTQPFRAVCKLVDGRVNSADGLLFLDSLLYHAWFAKYDPEVLRGTKAETNPKHFGLPLRQLPRNRYAASCGFYTQYAERVEYWNKRPDFDRYEMRLDMGNASAVDTSAGPLKSYRMPQIIRTVSDIVFYGYGTIDKIRDLLSYVSAVGKKPAAGWGVVNEWIVEPWPEDWSTWSDTYGLMRPIPIGEDIGHELSPYVIRDCAIRPPAWKPANQTTCYVPEVRT